MKSFLAFLKEHATLVYEDTALKYQTQDKNQEVVSFDPHVKQGYYLYFVEYQSIGQQDIENVYFGIKHSPGIAGDPSNFWASLKCLLQVELNLLSIYRLIKNRLWQLFISCKELNSIF